MKPFFTLILIMSNLSTMAQDGKAITVKKTFSRTTTISKQIDTEVSVVWTLLTDAKAFPNWNSTVISIDGDIVLGQKIKLVSTLDPSRTFKLKVKEMIPNQKMVWGDAMGKRTYTLVENSGGVKFSMSEKIGGPIFPLFASKIPSFDESFEQFAADLKKKAESINTK